ncbi:hypothetical protein [Tissierella creatinophila]|uniref:Uncharacterized protein n=1 Tax=Tissierella creatinophila DSM 6911 TaxID=1123403 RepID=A0A1U7M675_TISCR|nr:hypothetical protein [Tissierella creatinophila]OLS02823.1 hypothetical protein TICRE_11730 [Tissierella creatinophila DSM 6911]
MQDFDKITIQEMSKEDMLLIIQALEYTGTHTKIQEFLDLRDSFIEELSSLSEIPQEDFLNFLKKETLS